MEEKQPVILKTIRQRISDGTYPELLPTSRELAEEFQVNIKTVNKALARLVASGVIKRRRRLGTRITGDLHRETTANRLVEVVFEGFTTVFSHPFWADIWEGMVTRLSAAGFRAVLTPLESDPVTGLIKPEVPPFTPAAGRIVLGISEARILDLIRATGTPFVTACDPVDDPTITQVTFDFAPGIRDAVDFLAAAGGSRIAFVGQTRSLVNPGQLQKFNAYLAAVQRHTRIDPALIGDARPLRDSGAPALAAILDRATPDALLAAYDHQLPELLALLRERHLNIPVVGCDGVIRPGTPLRRHVVIAPRYRCGETAADLLIRKITSRRRVHSETLPVEFHPAGF